MSRKPNYFDRMFIANPCPVDWDKMIGDEKIRHCNECNKNVYDLSKMTRDKAEALVARFEGQLCGRFERGADGRILTQENASGAQLIPRRASPVASAVVTAILGLSPAVVAANAWQSNATAQTQSQSETSKTPKQPQTGEGTASLSVTVINPAQALIPAVQLTLKNDLTGEIRKAVSSNEGAFSFTSLQSGSYTLTVEADGFSTTVFQSVNLKPNENTELKATMQVAVVEVPGGVMAAPPMTLRELYEKSERIVVARIGKSKTVKKEDDDWLIKTALEVSRNLKGRDKKTTIYVYHWGWGEDRTFPGGYKKGQQLIFFLVRGENGGYEILSTQEGLKGLSEDVLNIYEKRIEEIAAITKSEKSDAAAITEWLVRCAEQPATRWDGAYELYRSEESFAEQRKSHELAGSSPADITEPQPNARAAKAANASDDEDNQIGDLKFAAMLTEQQKGRLMTALFNTAELKETDMELVELAKIWQDPRLLPFLTHQLRRVETDPPYMVRQVMSIIADALKDEDIKALVLEYNQTASYEDFYPQEPASPEPADSENDSQTDDETATDAEKTDPAQAKQRRSDMLRNFLLMLDKKMANR